ncbi:septal ring lytic transglycosylase RlpA family protein [Roseomonas gilardii subsp. gilardii]|uniref:septal ring lytic transglycosylase RlpA family protein n=1 Tax=Roseomonas gilardii TaxID=257708 RepID=UPI001FF92496|nr:septal ring lytic transglycosylase RlpA family protein [Roseomonas gilardii]UPG73209.1 septal ring lytic transglycosylase RlpA family protein [Roseomonas gilardii subsp. gilardii]
MVLTAPPGVSAASPVAVAAASDGSVVELTRPTVRPPMGHPGEDRSGDLRQGTAGLITFRIAGEPMANGMPYDPSDYIAASSVLPLGSTLRVKNLENGRITMVQVRDVAPQGSDRLIDLSNQGARAIGLTTAGAAVQIAPLAVPQADGSIRLGAGTGLAGQRAAPSLSDRPREPG